MHNLAEGFLMQTASFDNHFKDIPGSEWSFFGRVASPTGLNLYYSRFNPSTGTLFQHSASERSALSVGMARQEVSGA
jgi:hypothetical protein